MEVCHFLNDSNMKITKCRVKLHFLIIYVLGSRSILGNRCYLLLFRCLQHKFIWRLLRRNWWNFVLHFWGDKNGEFKSRISVFEGNVNVCKIFPFESFLRFLNKAAMQHVLRTQLLIRHPKLTCSNTHLLFFRFIFF